MTTLPAVGLLKNTLKLSQQGWTQQDIATQTGLSRTGIESIIDGKFNVKEIVNSYQQGKPVEEIAEYHKLDPTTTWSLILADKTDTQRLQELQIKPKVYDVWNFSNCHHVEKV